MSKRTNVNCRKCRSFMHKTAEHKDYSIDKRHGIAYFPNTFDGKSGQGEYDHTEETEILGVNVNVDLTREGRVIGFEVMDYKKLAKKMAELK